jgi:epithelial splicing regulatory protein 1/2
LNYLKRSNSEAQAFLQRDGQVIIRMRGLPFDATAKDVIEFFTRGDLPTYPVDGEEGVLFVHYPDGRSTGDAFIMVKTEHEASQALLKHKEIMGTRYIELFRSTTAEVQQVFRRSQDPKNFQTSLKDIPFAPLPILPPEMLSGGNKKDCIRVRNLPVECGIEQILEFLGVHSQHIVAQGVHMVYNAHGQPSGEAFIQMDSEAASFNAAAHKNNKYMFFNGKKDILKSFNVQVKI